MRDSVAPKLPDSGWKILYDDALTRFLRTERNLEWAGAVTDWIVACRRDGPPRDGIDAGADVHLSQIAGSRVTAEYLVIEAEFLIIVKDFR